MSSHIEERMVDRRFNEIDLRLMLEEAVAYHPAVVTGRWVIETRHGGSAWEIIVQPAPVKRILVVVTAYPVA